MDSRGLSVIVLAAGEGSRMHSARPKPLHRLCGQPMVRFVLDAISELDPRRVVVVVGKDGQRVAKELADVEPVTDIVDQVSRGGTADAVRVGLAPLVDDDLSDDHHDDDVLVVPGDIPLVTGATLRKLVTEHRAQGVAATVLARPAGSADSPGPRVVRSERDGSVERVAAFDDLVGRERDSTEQATGIWCVRRPLLAPAIRRLRPDAESGEISLAGVAEVLAATGNRVEAHLGTDGRDVVGVNDRVDLATAEVVLRARINDAWLRRGVTMVDPSQTYVDATVQLAPDVTIFPGVILQGTTVVGEGTEIGPGTRLVDTRVGPRCRLDHTTAEVATIGADSRVGPYAVLTAGAEIAAATVTGPFYTAGADGP